MSFIAGEYRRDMNLGGFDTIPIITCNSHFMDPISDGIVL